MSTAGYHPLYLGGIECFNRRDYFESHEVWEDLWNLEQGPARKFYQGLIQAAVALHHLTRGNRHGADKLLTRCRCSLGPFRPKYLGLDLEQFLAQVADCFDSHSGDAPGHDGRVPQSAPQIQLETLASGSVGSLDA
jgi:predicted metal-dependent hydrolase